MSKNNKDVFITRLMRDRDKFEILVNRIGFTRQLAMPGVLGKWSIKDMLAHLLSCEQYIADRLEEILHNEPYIPCKTQTALDAFLDQFGYPDLGSPLLDEDAPKEWVVEKYKNVSLEEIVTQELNAFTSIIASLEKLREDVIDSHNLYERIANNTYKQYREHIRNIKKWLALNAANAKNS
jgi:hypothetical protein